MSVNSNGAGNHGRPQASRENELSRIIGGLRRRAIPILLTVLVVAGGAVALSMLQDDQYTASASILFRSQTLAQELPGNTSATVDPQTQAATNLELVSLQRVSARTARQLGPRFDQKEISGSVDVVPKGASNVIDVKATWRIPGTSARIATAFAHQFVGFQADAERARIRAAQRRLELALAHVQASAIPQEARMQTIQTNLDELQVLKSVSSGQAQVIQRANVPTAPSSPKPVRNAVIGVFAGLLLGIALAIALEQLDRRVRSGSEFEELLGIPLLAQIPKSNGFIHDVAHPISDPPVESEFFNVLVTTIQRLDHGSGVNSLVVTSPTAEVGKTTVAVNLAIAATRAGTRTLLLEVDLRRPMVAERLGIGSKRNLLEAINDELPLPDVVQSVPVPVEDGPESADAYLDVVVGGAQIRDAQRLVESSEMHRLLKEAEETYDLVIVDSPPAGLISDAIVLLSMVEAAIVVGRVGTTTRDQALWLRSQLEQVDANVLGVVANFAPVKIDQYYGAYLLQAASQTRRAYAASEPR